MNKREKRGLSTIVTTIIMILLVMASIVIVWTFVKEMIERETEGSKSCSEIYGKIEINSRYTCYNSSSNEFQFSINIGDIEVDGVLVSISGDGETKTLKIENDEQIISGLKNYSRGSTVKLPRKNGGLTYIFNMTEGGFSGSPDAIELAPIINEKQCSVTDSLSEIDDCLLFIS